MASTVNSAGNREPPIDGISTYQRLVEISYRGTVHRVDRIKIDEKYLRNLFKKFPSTHAIVLVGETGESIPMEEFSVASGACNTFRMIEGDQISNGTGEISRSGKKKERLTDFFRQGESDDSGRRDLLRPPRPIFNSRRSRSRSPPATICKRKSKESESRMYISIERGVKTSARKVVPCKHRKVRNVAVKKKEFTFGSILDAAYRTFEVPSSEEHRFSLMNSMGQVLMPDDKYNDVLYWEKRSKNSMIFLVENDETSDESSDESESAGVTTRNQNQKEAMQGQGSPRNRGEIEDEAHIPINLDDDDYFNNDVDYSMLNYINAETPPLNPQPMMATAPPPAQQQDQILAVSPSNTQTERPNVTESNASPALIEIDCDNFDDVVDRLKCVICSNIAIKPQQCPRFGHNMGGETCVNRWFSSQVAAGRKKTCPKCRSEVTGFQTHQELAAIGKSLQGMKLRCFQFCPE